MDFVHLHVHSEYTLLDSVCRIDKLTDKAKELGMDALAITDRNVMYGILPFYKSCIAKGIQPILGLEVDLWLSNELNSSPIQVLLYAKNNRGYQNLINISSKLQNGECTGSPSLPIKEIQNHSSGLIAVSTGVNGIIQSFLLQQQGRRAIEFSNQLRASFREGFYLGVEDHGTAKEGELNLHIVQLSKELDIPLVATNNVYYLDKENVYAYEALGAIKHGRKITDEVEGCLPTHEHYFKNKQEMSALFSHLPDAIERSNQIAQSCKVDLSFGNAVLPKYPTGQESSSSLLQRLCMKGLQARYGPNPSDLVIDRMNYELTVIDQMGFNDYFLIVWDFMKYAREENILTGPGRGSAAGSIVGYVLFITQVDPIEHELLFERFLNPERISMPDIDIDFPDTKRDLVIKYVVEKYGKNHVAQILTFGTLAAKAAIRDVGRVLNLENALIDQIAKQIPSKPGISLDKATHESPLLKRLIGQSEEVRNLWSIAKTIEGIPRHTSTHAAGVVISSVPLNDIVPTQSGNERVSLTQYTMEGLEDIGLLKMDFLGLRNLTLLEEITKSIEKDTQTEIALHQLPFNDKSTYTLLSKGDTTGIFQLESDGMKRVLRKLQPTDFEDIVAVNALYRPGPMENIPLYIERKHRKKIISYPHPDLKPILEKTYGVIVYQEQIIQIASTLAGFSLGEADLLRRAVSKKQARALHEQREHFVKGALKRGYETETANRIYDLIVQFANYGFNRSHAVAYSVIAYQLAYLKANYPVYYMAELLSSTIGNHSKTAAYLSEVRQNGISILPPSINRSEDGFTVECSDGLRIGLLAVKNVGLRAIEEILIERQKGIFKHLFDLCRRVSLKVLNKRSLESLILAGSLDDFGTNRAQLLANLDAALEYGINIQNTGEKGQIALFPDADSIPPPSYDDVPPFEEKEKLQFEYEALGFYLSGHPVEQFTSVLDAYRRIQIGQLGKEQQAVRIGTLITKSKAIKTKKGEWMAFLQLSDETGELEGIVFPNLYRINPDLYQEGNYLLIEGKLDKTEEDKIIVQKAMNLYTLKLPNQPNNQNLYIKIGSSQQQEIQQIKNIILQYPGDTDIILYNAPRKKTIRLSSKYRVDPVRDCVIKLESLLGSNNVVLK